jgi:hypothetical protein
MKQLSIAEVSTKTAMVVDESLEGTFSATISLPSTPSCSASSPPMPTSTVTVVGGIVGDEDDMDVLPRRVDVLPPGAEDRRIASTGHAA